MRSLLSGHGKQNHNGRKDHQVGIEQDEHAGMVEAPSALQAAGGLRHAPRGNQQGKNLPSRAAQVSDVRKPGQAQAGRKRRRETRKRTTLQCIAAGEGMSLSRWISQQIESAP